MFEIQNSINTFNCGQLSAMANKDASVINVPPTFRCCKEAALEICNRRKMQNVNSEIFVNNR